MTSTKTAGAFLTRVGNLSVHRSDDATGYVLTVTATGEYVGTYPTAKAATDAGVARIAAAHKARRNA
jgi:hypothetical protein